MMSQVTKVTDMKVSSMGLVNILIQLEMFLKEDEKIIGCTVMVNILGLTVESTEEITMKTKNLDMVRFIGQTDKYGEATG